MEEILILSCADVADGGGIYRYALDGAGALRPLAYLACPKPMYAVTGGGRLHVLLRAPFEGSGNSGYFSCLADFSDGSPVTDTLGKCACHLAADRGDLYIVNYLSGNLVKNCRDTVTHHGAGVNLPRQNMPHTHFACLSPDGAYVLCCDLGLDTVFVYDRELREVSRAAVPAGYGVRHLVFSEEGDTFFAVNELVPSVSIFSYGNGKAAYIDTVSLPCRPGSTAAAIRLDRETRRLYVSVRGENRLYAFDVRGAALSPLCDAPCGGCGPRDFAIFGDRIVCTNENSDSVTVLRKRDLRVLGHITLRSPLCVLKAGEINGL